MTYCWKVCREKADLLSKIIEINHNWKMDCSQCSEWIKGRSSGLDLFQETISCDDRIFPVTAEKWKVEKQVRSRGQELRNHQLWQKSGSKRLALIQDSPPLIPDIRLKGQTSKGIWPDTRHSSHKRMRHKQQISFGGGESNRNFTGPEKSVLFLFP